MDLQLKGKRAVVLGGTRGIGRAIAETLAAEGADVAVCARNREQVEEAVSALSKKGVRSTGAAVDIANGAELRSWIDGVAKTFGGLDILVSNAGIQIVHPIEDFPFADWKKMLAIHLDGAFLTTKACVKHMYKQNSGALIYMGSVHSHEASALKSAYVTAKHGLIGLARTMAKEGAKHNVRSNVICPGFVRTPLVDKQIPEQAKELGISEERVIKEIMLAETVDKEFTTVADVAEVALMLGAFETNALTGQSIVVSHGWHMS